MIITSPAAPGLVRVTFGMRYGVGSHDISVVGDFNGWSRTVNPMTCTGYGVYSAEMTIPTDRRYRFRYLVDNLHWQIEWAAKGHVLMKSVGTTRCSTSRKRKNGPCRRDRGGSRRRRRPCGRFDAASVAAGVGRPSEAAAGQASPTMATVGEVPITGHPTGRIDEVDQPGRRTAFERAFPTRRCQPAGVALPCSDGLLTIRAP